MARQWEDIADLADLRGQQRRREMAARYSRHASRRKLKQFEADVTDRLIKRLHDRGLTDVHRTTDNAPFDLWVCGVRVEVKAARWEQRTPYGKRGKGGRFQAHMRNHQADVIFFVAVNGRDHDFIIPQEAVGHRKTLEISSYDVSAYRGQWRPWLEAWDVLQGAIEATPDRPRQLQLLEVK